jgi:hypothetical protein
MPSPPMTGRAARASGRDGGDIEMGRICGDERTSRLIQHSRIDQEKDAQRNKL